MTAAIPLPPLPEPQRSRWQPLRMGLVDLYHYDCEEFWFRDGHILLRGNNGTGKSKVLSLALPFLLDLNLSPARVEPDGDRTKRMEWNLLMGRYERRTGYTWIEFGRRDEEGEAHYLTLGCGLSAVAGRPRVEPWPFLTELRVGEDLWLVNRERVVLSRERLAETLAGRGHIFDTAHEYRRAVDERLFRLGEERYRALIETLIQLRQPQLSRKPDEQTLSNALTEALAPLPQATLEDVAEAMTQLEEYRRELDDLERLRKDVAQFVRHYAVYARVRARREARFLRQAQTEFDYASRTLNEARAAFEAACAEVSACDAEIERLRRALMRDRAAVSELERDPVIRDAGRLREAEARADESAKTEEESRTREENATRHLASEQAEAARCRNQSEATLARLAAAARRTGESAAGVGLASEHDAAQAKLLPYERLGNRTREDMEKLLPAMRAAIQRRRDHVAQIRGHLYALAKAAALRDHAVATRSAHHEQFEAAQARAREADAEVKRRAAAHLEHWRAFIEGLTGLVFEPADALDALAAWVESQAGDHPLGAALLRAQSDALSRLASEEAAAEHERTLLTEQRTTLAAERERLLEGVHPVPAAPYTRAPDVRAQRPGAPLWQLLDFRDQVNDRARAALEAALEAAGLLDAWVTPEGVALEAGTHDVLLVPRAAVAEPLSEWLRPAAEDRGVAPARIDALLASIACSVDEPCDTEAWISPEGRFRIGPAAGAWAKPAAQYIGYATRETARRARLQAVESELQELDIRLATLQDTLRAVGERRERVNAEYAQAPSHTALRDAHTRFATAESQRREAHDRFAEADERVQMAEQAWAQVREALERDAEDLRLPHEMEALEAFERSLGDYADLAGDFAAAALECQLTLAEGMRQDERERDARAQAEYWRAERKKNALAAEAAAARRDVLRESVGAAVHELEARLARTQDAVRLAEAGLIEARKHHSGAVEARGATKQKAQDAQQTLDERQKRRQESVDQLQGFARTGLISVAIDDPDIPDRAAPWTIDPALQLARRIEQALADVPAEDVDWTRIQSAVSSDFNQLVQAMAAQGQQAQSEQSDYGLIVHIVYRNRPERPNVLERRLASEIGERREILTAHEREVLENHLQAEVAASLQRLMQESERRVRTINAELERRPTSTGVRFRLDWQALPEGEDGAPVGLAAARNRLLQRAPDAWSPEDRRIIGAFLQRRIEIERTRDEGVALLEHLTRALDYRRWHRFRIRRLQEGEWRPLSGPASSGERALGLTVPLFAAASSHYASADYPHAPRLVLLDEAYAGIDDEARAHCMALMREFDLDFVMTSEREWGCYSELPGLAICQLVRREGIDAVYVSRWSWDGLARREELDPSRRFAEAAAS